MVLVLSAAWIASVASTNHFQHLVHGERELCCCSAGAGGPAAGAGHEAERRG